MESIYWVLSWACHRRCRHCYETRFRPYVREELAQVVGLARDNAPAIIENLPERHTFLDLASPREDGPRPYEERPGRIILAGGEVLIDPVRETVLYPTLERLAEKYRGQGVLIAMQTTGDLVTARIVDELLERGVGHISISGMDDFHVGMEGEKRVPLQERLCAMFEKAGMVSAAKAKAASVGGNAGRAVYSFFGATEDAWIGKIWPRGRAWENDLSRAGITDNFCNVWSGGLNFLNHRYSGSEVAIEPTGDVYPCCLKTKMPVGNVMEEKLTDILDSLVGHPAFEAISMGHPERMGLAHGWDVDTFLEKSRTVTPGGRPYRNLCIGCDRFFAEKLGPVIRELREQRLARRSTAAQ